MKGFIEVTLFRNCEPTNVLVSLGQIKYVEKDIESGKAVIACACVSGKGKGWTSLSLAVKETYEEVVAKIKEATE